MVPGLLWPRWGPGMEQLSIRHANEWEQSVTQRPRAPGSCHIVKKNLVHLGVFWAKRQRIQQIKSETRQARRHLTVALHDLLGCSPHGQSSGVSRVHITGNVNTKELGFQGHIPTQQLRKRSNGYWHSFTGTFFKTVPQIAFLSLFLSLDYLEDFLGTANYLKQQNIY